MGKEPFSPRNAEELPEQRTTLAGVRAHPVLTEPHSALLPKEDID